MPRLDWNAIPELWIDCFHFSVVTAATVGYGDIVPRTWFAKIIVDTQIITVTAILVFGVGFIMSERSINDA